MILGQLAFSSPGFQMSTILLSNILFLSNFKADNCNCCFSSTISSLLLSFIFLNSSLLYTNEVDFFGSIKELNIFSFF